MVTSIRVAETSYSNNRRINGTRYSYMKYMIVYAKKSDDNSIKQNMTVLYSPDTSKVIVEEHTESTTHFRCVKPINLHDPDLVKFQGYKTGHHRIVLQYSPSGYKLYGLCFDDI